MDEQKKPVGRPQIYQGWQPEQTGRRRPKPAQRPQEERRKGEYRPLAVTEQNVGESSKVLQMPIQQTEQKTAQQTEQKTAQQAEQKTVQQTEQKTAQQVQSEVRPAVKRSPQAVEREQKIIQAKDREPYRQSQASVKKPAHRTDLRPQQMPVQKAVHQAERRPLQPAEEKQILAAKRRREQENEKKMRSLWCVFGFLCIALIAAIFYEVILGHGIKETGAERMEEQKQEFVVDTEENNIEILTPGGELVSEIRERENRRNLPRETEAQTETQTEEQTAGVIEIVQ